jgi:hypothetical protein
MASRILLWGAVAGIVHFVALGILYGNPFIDRMYVRASDANPAVKKWTSKPRYLLVQLMGTQIEVYILTIGYFWLRPLINVPGLDGAMLLALLFAGIRVYPRFWNMWIQSTYPGRLLGTEFVNGTIGTLVVILTLHFVDRP